MHQSLSVDRLWLKRFGRRGSAANVRLLCFHHAGGSASAYRQWARDMSPSIEPIAVQLPGRADRFAEPPFDRMQPLIEALVEAVTPVLDRPFACYGASMGSRVAWALTHALRERSLPLPSRLYLACDIAPACDDGTWPWENRTDGLEGYLREMGGTPPELLAEPELLRALLPTLQADLTVLSTHGFRPEVPLDMPIHAFAGTTDPTAPVDLMSPWAQETTAAFTLDTVVSGHFFDPDAERQVMDTIGRDLVRRH